MSLVERCTAQSRFSDPGEFAGLFDQLPRDIAGLSEDPRLRLGDVVRSHSPTGELLHVDLSRRGRLKS
jgi:hypothetical protein